MLQMVHVAMCGASALLAIVGMTKSWSLTNTTQGARTVSEIETLSKKPASKCLGCINIPISKAIPIDHVIIDTLHLFLRVADLLIYS